MSLSDPSVDALISLLADDQTSIAEVARTRLIELDHQAIPFLQKAVRSHKEFQVRQEAEQVLNQIFLGQVSREWARNARLPDPKLDLEKSTLLLARVCYPQMNPQHYRKLLDQLADRVRSKLSPAADLKAQVQVLSQVLQQEGFRGNWSDYFDPENSYLNRVLDRKLGIPITLSVLYLLVGRRLELSLQGVGIPGHFMIRAQNGPANLFVDPFNGGRFLSRAQCVQFIVEAGYPYQSAFLEGIGTRDILVRMIRNLILIYVELGDEVLETTLGQFLDLLIPSADGSQLPDFEGGRN